MGEDKGMDGTRAGMALPPTPPEGLSAAEAEKRRQAGHGNILRADPGKSLPLIAAHNLFTWFNALNAVLALALAIVGSWRNMLFLGVVISNTLIGTVQEIRAARMIRKLQLKNAARSRVLRDGAQLVCRPEELVRGDLVVLLPGDQVPADAVVVEGAGAADESVLTGESEPAARTVGDTLFFGSWITEGRFTAQLTHVGDESRAAALMRDARRIRGGRSKLMSDLNTVLHKLTYILVPLGLCVFARQVFFSGKTAAEAVPPVVAAMLGMIPEGLVLLTSVALEAGVVRLGSRGALVQELFGIESLARTDVLCTDKTGTLTTGEMRLRGIVPLDADEETVRAEAARLLAAFDAAGGTLKALKAALPQKENTAAAVLPFSSGRKKSAASFAGADGRTRTLILGAPSFVTGQAYGGTVREKAETLAEQGARVLLLAEAEGAIGGGDAPPPDRLLGLLVLEETLRSDVRETLGWFRDEGVSVRVISGDDPRTAAAVAARAGLDGADRYVDCGLMSDAELAASADQYTVFGRVTPERKKLLVDALKAAGHTVTMTGDGVNDIAAMKASDCSVAMGGGADAARHAAQITLLDGGFSALPQIVAEGRRVINNITRTASLFLVKTGYSFFLSLMTLLSPLAYPFQPVHLTLISTFTVGLPSLVLALEPNHARVKGDFLRTVAANALPGASGIAFCALAAMVTEAFGRAADAPTMAVISAAAVGLGVLVRTCMPMTAARAALCAGMGAAMAAAIAFLPKVFFLRTAALTASEWVLLGLITACGFAVMAAVRRIILRHRAARA